jgi:RND superfamily putative drug exporter
MTGPLYHLGRFCSRRHWLVIGAWVLVAAALVVTARATGDKTSDNLTLPNTGSTDAQDLLQDRLPKQAYGSNPLVFKAGSGKLTDSKNSQAVDQTVKNLKKLDGVTSAISPLSKEGKAFLSKNKTVGYIPLTLDISPSDITKEESQDFLDAADPAEKAGMETAIGGYVGQQLSKPDTESSEAIGLAAAVIILLFAFGTATAMALPIITAILGLACALAIIQLLGNVFDVPSVAPTLGTMIGLGVGIDYALFVVTRHKLQLKDDMEIEESTARATATAGGAVFFAGGTVVIALCSLSVAGIPLVTNMGISSAVSVVVAVLAAITLLPALLGALGPKINSLRVHLGGTHPDDHEPHGWARWAGGVSKRPFPAATLSVVVLLVLAIPVLNLQLGQSDNGELPKDTTGRQAYDLISEGFGPGTNGPLLVSVKFGTAAKPDQKNIDSVNQQEQKLKTQQQQIEQQALAEGASQQQAQQEAQQQTKKQSSQLATKKKQAEAPQTDPRLTKLQDDISKTKGVKSVSPTTLDKKGTAGVFTVISTTAPSDEKTETLVRNLRDDVIPKAIKGTDLDANVGGQTAAYIDLADRISSKLPLMIAVVVGLSFLVLLLAFRSVLVPLKAAMMNLLSVAAAYGIVTFIFQEGHGATLIGLEGATPIVSFVPLMMFAILFGLSMDYEVFLLSQIQDHYKEDGVATKAVIDGLATTGRVITSAALIMVCVFTSFVVSGDPTVKQFGVGLAVAIAIDATLVRCLLVPAVMVLLQDRAWWLPKWIDRVLPHFSIEGEDYFAERDAKAAAKPAPAPAQTRA